MKAVLAQLLAEVRGLRAEVGALRDRDQVITGKDALTKQAAADRLSISLSTLKGMIRRGELRTVVIGKRALVPARELARVTAPARDQPAEKKPAKRTRGGRRPSGMSEAAKFAELLRQGSRRGRVGNVSNATSSATSPHRR